MSEDPDRIKQLEKKVEALEEQLDDDDGVSRRDLLAGAGAGGLAGLLGVGALAESSGQASASTAPNYGTPSNPSDFYAVDIFGPNGNVNFQAPVDMNGEDIKNAGSVSTERIGNGPIVFSSRFNTIQAALDAAAGGHLFIDDTKTEDGIAFNASHAGTTIEWVGDNAIHQPDNPTPGEAVMRAEDGLSSDVPGLTFIGMRITNPNLSDADIGTEDTVAGGDRTSAFSWVAPAVTASNTTGRLVSPEFIRPNIDHVNGHGIALQQPKSGAKVENPTVDHVAYDGVYIASLASENGGAEIEVTGFDISNTGRHFVALAGEAVEDYAKLSGVGDTSYTAGIDLEDAQNVELDATLRNTTTSENTGTIASGLAISSNSTGVSGRVTVINPNSAGANIAGDADELTVVTRQSASQNPADQPAVNFKNGSTANVTAKVNGGGASYGAISISSSSPIVRAEVSNAYGPSVRTYDASEFMVDVLSHEPAQGGSNLIGRRQSHVVFTGSGTTENGDVNVVGRDTDGNVNYAVNSDGTTDYNRVSGCVRGAYSSGATTSLGANTDTSDLIT